MRECWLRPNRRALSAGLIVPTLALAAGLALAFVFHGSANWRLLSWTGWGLTAVGISGVVVLLMLMQQPRLAYSGAHLLVFLGSTQPFRVPIDLVECFFLGHGPSMLPPAGGREAETSTIVVRLAESASQWKHRDVKPALGHWCDGYIVIRGTWCEPISGELVERLNARLVEAHRRIRRERELETA